MVVLSTLLQRIFVLSLWRSFQMQPVPRRLLIHSDFHIQSPTLPHATTQLLSTSHINFPRAQFALNASCLYPNCRLDILCGAMGLRRSPADDTLAYQPRARHVPDNHRLHFHHACVVEHMDVFHLEAKIHLCNQQNFSTKCAPSAQEVVTVSTGYAGRPIGGEVGKPEDGAQILRCASPFPGRSTPHG